MSDTTNDPSIEYTGTTTTAPVGDPVTGSTQPTQSTGTLSPDVESQLKSFLDSVGKNPTQQEPTGDEPQQEDSRPTGGLNDLTPEDVGDPSLSRFVQLLDLHYPKLDRERAVGKAIEYGDATYIDEAYIREVAGDAASVLIGYFEDAVNIYGTSVENNVKAIYEMAGGKERWGQVATAFTSHAPQGIRTVVKSLVDSNNPEDVRQGLEFILEYTQKAGYVDTPAQRMSTAGGTTGGNALSAEQFREEVRKLGGRNRDPRKYDQEVGKLRQRRAKGITLGL